MGWAILRQVTNDLVVPATLVNPPGLATPAVYDLAWATLNFESGKNCVQQLIFQLPHGYAEGEDVEFHIHWEADNTNTGDVDLEIRWQWRDEGEVGVAVADWNIEPVSFAAPGVARKLTRQHVFMISKPTAKISSIIQMQITRLGTTDSYTGDLCIVSQDCHVLHDSTGSRSYGAK